jgi:actin-related protein
LKSIIVSGGTTMYDGLADRLKAEVLAVAPPGSDVRIIASADRKFSVWKGASTLASLSTFESSWITKEEYDEMGADVISRKCPA